ncbi:DUF262 domain-containing protein [Kineococcus endophyticus]|uniref:DUF262 domain-containing protein n=2 Tax=Kineococcus endophyticus TaxID=1181883 RepID=A0ABV3P2V2_9ACTN
MDARNRSVADWLPRLRSGQVQLPRFQRFEAWGYGQVKALLESIINDLPAGAVTVLEVGDNPPFKHRELAGAPGAKERLNELLLDGQQRLTALWRSLTGDYEDRTYYVLLNEESSTDYGGRAVAAVKRTYKEGKKYPLWADDPAQCFAKGYVPATLLLPETVGGPPLQEWIKAATSGDSAQGMELMELLTKLRGKVSSFNLPAISLPVGTSKATVLEVFTRINTGHTPLSAFDIVTTDVEEAVGASLHDLLDTLTGTVAGLSRYGDVQDIVLRTAALMQNQTPDRPSILDLNWNRVVDEWPLLVDGALKAVEFLEQERLFDAARLPIVTPVPALIALWSQTRDLKPDAVGAARTNLRKYLWRAFFTERYESSAHTQVIKDVRELADLLHGKRSPDKVDIFNLPLPASDELATAAWPKKRDRLARSVLAVSLYGSAIDLADGSSVSAASLGRREYHHVFPDGYLKKLGEKTPSSLALNCALITWRTNRTISDKEPLQYMKERSEASSLGDEEILYRLKTHAIPSGPLLTNNYQTFLDERRQLVEEAMKQLTEGMPFSP